MKFLFRSILLFAVATRTALGQVKGTPTGFAAGTTGGGTATPVYPTSLAQYVITDWGVYNKYVLTCIE
jgi:hypothetical protein